MKPRIWTIVSLLAWGALAPSRTAHADDAATLGSLEAALYAHHPSLRSARGRRALSVAERASTGLPAAPELVAQTWATPLARPYALGDAQMLMLGARVRSPVFAARRAERQAQTAEIEAATHEAADLVLALRATLREACATLWKSQRALRLIEARREQADTVRRSAEAGYAAGRVPETALRDLTVEEVRLEQRRAELIGEADEARRRVNVLVGRPAQAPLTLADLPAPQSGAALDGALRSEAADTPMTRAAGARVRSAEAGARAAQVMATRPEFSFGLDYMAMASERDYARYGAMVGMSLPWLSGRGRAETARADAATELGRAQAAELRAAQALEVHAAAARFEAARAKLDVLEAKLLPALREAEQSALRGIASGTSDALSLWPRSAALLDAELEALSAEQALQLAAIALERSLGIDLHVSNTEPGSP